MDELGWFLDGVWIAMRALFIATVMVGGVLALVFAVKESVREYRHARALELAIGDREGVAATDRSDT